MSTYTRGCANCGHTCGTHNTVTDRCNAKGGCSCPGWASQLDGQATTKDEASVLGHLAAAWNGFIALPMQHSCEREEFMRAIHVAQGVVACRIAQRTDPTIWGAGTGQ